MSFRLVLKSVTVGDPERRNGPYFAIKLAHRTFVPERSATQRTINVGLRMILNGVMALFCVISANSGSFRAHCVKVHFRYLFS